MKLYVADIKCLDDERDYEKYLYKVNEQRRAMFSAVKIKRIDCAHYWRAFYFRSG